MGPLRRIAFLAALCLPFLAFPHNAKADDIQTQYTFSGTCADDDCTYDSGTLTLVDYTPGTALTVDNFVSFSYSSDIETFTMTSDGVYDLSGVLDTTTGAYSVSFYGDTTDSSFLAFNSDATSGSWCAQCAADYGPSHTWTYDGVVNPSATPEPASLALLSTGLAGIPYVRRRMRRQAA